ncbi:MAG: (deoxy)nucleoside triphosphate pyrophosphohydrolase [Polyangiaceae bacterium]
MTRLHVVAAAIFTDQRVLAARRGAAMREALKWEFPGGKIEPGESAEAALARELREELDVQVLVGERLGVSLTSSIELELYACRLHAGTPEPREHAELRWLTSGDLAVLDWAPADIPLLEVVAAALQR